MEVKKKILVIQTAFTGDVILATALLEQLHEKYEATQIHLLVRKGNESLFNKHPFVLKVYTWDKEKKYRSLLHLHQQLKKVRWDAILNLQRFGATGLLTFLLNSKLKIGFKKNPFSFSFHHKIPHEIQPGIHEVERNARLLEPLGIQIKKRRPQLYPSKQNVELAKQYQDTPYITIAPASIWFTKQLPKEKWVELVQKFTEDITVLILGAPGDFELAESIIVSSDRKNIQNLCGKTNLLTSAAIMKEAMMNYVNDSAPMHIASSMNAPVTAFYCSTLPDFGFGPLSDNSKVIQIESELSCRPCGLHGHKKCPEDHFKCAYNISIPEPMVIKK